MLKIISVTAEQSASRGHRFIAVFMPCARLVPYLDNAGTRRVAAAAELLRRAKHRITRSGVLSQIPELVKLLTGGNQAADEVLTELSAHPETAPHIKRAVETQLAVQIVLNDSFTSILTTLLRNDGTQEQALSRVHDLLYISTKPLTERERLATAKFTALKTALTAEKTPGADPAQTDTCITAVINQILEPATPPPPAKPEGL
jgi:hypothetical protein